MGGAGRRRRLLRKMKVTSKISDFAGGIVKAEEEKERQQERIEEEIIDIAT